MRSHFSYVQLYNELHFINCMQHCFPLSPSAQTCEPPVENHWFPAALNVYDHADQFPEVSFCVEQSWHIAFILMNLIFFSTALMVPVNSTAWVYVSGFVHMSVSMWCLCVHVGIFRNCLHMNHRWHIQAYPFGCSTFYNVWMFQ